MSIIEKSQKQKKIISLPLELKNEMQIEILTSEKKIFSGSIIMLIVTGEISELGICYNHHPLISMIKPGQICMINKHYTAEFFYISGGFLETKNNTITIMADTVIRGENIDKERALVAKNKALEIIKKGMQNGNLEREDSIKKAIVELTKSIAKLRVIKNI